MRGIISGCPNRPVPANIAGHTCSAAQSPSRLTSQLVRQGAERRELEERVTRLEMQVAELQAALKDLL
jgi:polyhydroxyalkanoate synthesis regulator phasin